MYELLPLDSVSEIINLFHIEKILKLVAEPFRTVDAYVSMDTLLDYLSAHLADVSTFFLPSRQSLHPLLVVDTLNHPSA